MSNIDIISDNKIYYVQVDNPNIDSIDIKSSNANDINIDVIDNGLTINSTGSVNEVNNLSDTVTWATVPDAYISESSVTQHESAITITESQISDFGTYLTNINSLSIDELSDVDTSTTAPTDGQVLFWDSATTNWVPRDPSAADAESVQINVKNLEGSALYKGDPVYIYGTVGATDVYQVKKCDASNSATMPAVGLLKQDLAINGIGHATIAGNLLHITTDDTFIDTGGTGDPSEGQTLYVKSGGGLTTVKPTGSTNQIQNVGKVGKVSGGTSGSIIVSCIMRTNDVPNLPTGRIWVGDSNTTTSGVIYLDEGNLRLGINTDAPTASLDIDSDILRLRSSKTPTSATDSGNAGDIAWDSGYIYVCVASNTWKRSALNTW